MIQAKEVLHFDSMLTPKIITIVYWLLLAVAVISGLGTMFVQFSFATFVLGILIAIGGAIGARIWCELLIVLFKINDNIKKLADQQA